MTKLYKIDSTNFDYLDTHCYFNWFPRELKLNGFIKSNRPAVLDVSTVPKTSKLRNCPLYFDRVPKCSGFTVIWTLLQDELNLTLQHVDDYYDENLEEPSIKICLDCTPLNKEVSFSGSSAVNYDDKYLQLMYCEPSSKLQFSWLFIFEPFQTSVWIALLSSSILLGVVHFNVEYSFDTWLIFLGQQPCQKWSFLMSLSLFCTTILSSWYLGKVTTNIIAPPDPFVFHKSSQLFQAGYKLVIPDEKFIGIFEASEKTSVEKLGVKYSRELFIVEESIDQFSKFVDTSWFTIMAQIKGTIAVFTDLRRYIGKKKNNLVGYMTNSSCHMLQENFLQSKFVWIMRGVMSVRLAKELSFLHAAHLPIYWYERYMRKVFLHMTQNGKTDKQKVCDGFCRMTLFGSSMHILLKLYIIKCGIIIILFVGEIIT